MKKGIEEIDLPEFPETVSGQPGLIPSEQSRSPNWLRRAAVGGMALVATWGGGKYSQDIVANMQLPPTALSVAYDLWSSRQSGDYSNYSASVHNSEEIDETISVGIWNLHYQGAGRYKEIEQLVDDYNLDVLGIQEANAKDARRLSYLLPGLNITFVMADPERHVMDGGSGNVIVTPQEQEDVDTKSLRGAGFLTNAFRTIDGFSVFPKIGNVIDRLTDDDDYLSKENRDPQEKRVAAAVTIKALLDGKLVDIRFINGHVAGNNDKAVHSNQLNGLMDFAEDTAKDGMPTFLGADFNGGNKEIMFAANKRGLISPRTPNPTSVNSRKTIDHIVYSAGSPFGLESIQVLKKPRTDHYPVVARFIPKAILEQRFYQDLLTYRYTMLDPIYRNTTQQFKKLPKRFSSPDAS